MDIGSGGRGGDGGVCERSIQGEYCVVKGCERLWRGCGYVGFCVSLKVESGKMVSHRSSRMNGEKKTLKKTPSEVEKKHRTQLQVIEQKENNEKQRLFVYRSASLMCFFFAEVLCNGNSE